MHPKTRAPFRRPHPPARPPRPPATRFWAFVFVIGLTGGLGAAGCKKEKKKILGNPEEIGKLARMAQGLEKAYADKPLPNVIEPETFSGRLADFQDFRQCAVRTYVARRMLSQRLREDGDPRLTAHASIGDEAVTECAVQAAVLEDDSSYCERLEADYPGPNGERQLGTLRCFDAWARVTGNADGCPLVWHPKDGFGRNPECLAVASRDQSFCFFADNQARCQALVRDDPALCASVQAAPDCKAAVGYWSGLISKDERVTPGDQVFDSSALAGVVPGTEEPTLHLTVTYMPKQKGAQSLRYEAPLRELAISWPTRDDPNLRAPAPSKLWGAPLPERAVHIHSTSRQFSVKLAFTPTRQRAQIPLTAPGPQAPATVVLVTTVGATGAGSSDVANLKRCWPDAGSRGTLAYETKAQQKPGGFVRGTLEASDLACDDGSLANLQATFRVAVSDLR